MQGAQPPLMERAGQAAAELVATIAPGGRILVLAGPGNNGGDAFVCARHLEAAFYDVVVVFPGASEHLPPDAAAAFAAWREAGGTTFAHWPDGKWDLIVDGLFGIGLARAPAAPYAELIHQANASGWPVLALDVPSGLSADTGRAFHPCVRARHTLSFLAWKPGLFTADGPDHCGKVHLADLGVPLAAYPPAPGELLTQEAVAGVLRPRPKNSHKGRFGSVAVVGGASGMVGAALAAGRAALYLGAGKVYVGLCAKAAPVVDPIAPELMLRPVETLPHVDVWAVGPGLGTGQEAIQHLLHALKTPQPLALDADALNIIAHHRELACAARAREAPTVLTPHPGEAARLLGCTVEEVQNDRIAAAKRLAEDFHAWVALKGAGTVLAGPGSRYAVNTSGNPGLASAGTGDVLTGFIAALLAQGLPAQAALSLAVHLHGAAADALVARGTGPVGLTASELLVPARELLNRWIPRA